MQTSGAVAQLLRPDGAFYNNALVRQPLSLLCRAMRLANLATGALLVLTGVLGLLSALTHVSLTVLTSALLSFYVGGTGAMLLLHELRWEPDLLRSQVGFMHTYGGRTAFLFLVANLGWTCDPLGCIASVVTNANALFHGYVILVHPAFASGKVQRLELYHEEALLQDRNLNVIDVDRDPAVLAKEAVLAERRLQDSTFEIAE